MLRLGAAVLILFTILCGALGAYVWASQSNGLIMAGARDVKIARDGISRLHLTYQLPHGQTLNDFRHFLAEHGWRRIKLSNSERLTLSFVRSGWPREVRDILVITLDPHNRTAIDLQFARCVVSRWFTCF